MSFLCPCHRSFTQALKHIECHLYVFMKCESEGPYSDVVAALKVVQERHKVLRQRLTEARYRIYYGVEPPSSGSEEWVRGDQPPSNPRPRLAKSR